MRYVYNLIFYIILPFLPIKLLLRARKAKAYKQYINERFAHFTTPTLVSSIWVHAVSVGEAIAAIPLIKALQNKYQNCQIVVTTMTPTGRDIISKNLGATVIQLYIPYDYPAAVKRFIRHINPKFLIIMETEIWPNILYYCYKNKIPSFLVNARLSEKSFSGYKKIKFFIANFLNYLTLVMAQGQKDGAHFLALGLQSEKLQIVGNIKFDLKIDEEIIKKGAHLRELFGSLRPVFIAASTHQGEEEKILEAFRDIQKIIPNILLILVPRHPERFTEVFTLCLKNNFITQRFSEINNIKIPDTTNIILGDVMGQLLPLYAASDIAFVGGSLVAVGGHNLLEPAALGLPIISGPNLFNFLEIKEALLKANALILVNNTKELTSNIAELVQNKNLAQQFGIRGKELIEQNKGTTQKIITTLEALI